MNYDEILTQEERDYLRQVGAMQTESIWTVARMVDVKIRSRGFISKDAIYGAFAFDLQKKTSSVRHWYYTYKFYGEFFISQYAGLSYSHLSWAMRYDNWEEILDWCVDNSASVDRMQAQFINAQVSDDGNSVIIDKIRSLAGMIRNLVISHPKKEVWLGILQDIQDELELAKVANL